MPGAFVLRLALLNINYVSKMATPKTYAGIGSRDTPGEILDVMRVLAGRLESDGWMLRSGGARGADSAFETGVADPRAKQIYLPAAYFNGRRANSQDYVDASSLPSWQQALATVNQYHPAPGRLSEYARALMARNAMQVLGPQMDEPASLVVAYTPSGGIVGGTGQALRMAQSYGIPIRNLGDPNTLRNVLKYLG